MFHLRTLAIRTGKALACAAAFLLGGALAQLLPEGGRSQARASIQVTSDPGGLGPIPSPVALGPTKDDLRFATGSIAMEGASDDRPKLMRELATPARIDLERDAFQKIDEAAFDFGGGRIITGATRRRMLLFTFDDGPDIRNTPRLLDLLDEYDVKAVFFLTTNRMAERTPWGAQHRELAREIVRRGHTLGNHTMNHAKLGAASPSRMRNEIDETSAFIEEVTGVYPKLFRPPGGIRSERLDLFLKERGYTTVLWNTGASDYKIDSPRLITNTLFKVLERRRREEGHQGGILLLHDIYAHTVEAFPMIMARIEAENCRLYRAGEELYDIVDDPRFFFEPAGPNDAPDATAAPGDIPSTVLAERQARLRARARERCPEIR